MFTKIDVCKKTRIAALLAPMLIVMCGGTAAAQDRYNEDRTTTVGTVSISGPNTLVVREGGRYQVFVYGRNATRPGSVPVGSRVRVVSTPGAERGVRVASLVTITENAPSGPSASAGGGNDEDVVPESVRDLERTIRRQARRYNAGVRAGFALDPELINLGVQAQVAAGFNRNVIFRPSVEFGWGELTTMFALNLEGIYRFNRESRWTPYFGVGPGFNFLHRGLTREDRNVDFGEFDFDSALNILGGVENRNGMFVELKTSVYADPAPSLRMVVGYNF